MGINYYNLEWKKELISGRIFNIARITKLFSGKIGFETSLFGTKKYELNINMPLFDTERLAFDWIENQKNWKRIELRGYQRDQFDEKEG